MNEYVLTMAAGTTSIRGILFDRMDDIVSMSQRPITRYYPEPGWVEQDPMELIDLVRRTISECMSVADPKDCVSIGITNQRETTVVWNRRTGLPVYNAPVWQDKRTMSSCCEIRETYGELINEKTGLMIDPYFSSTKIAWILDNVKGARQKARSGDLLFGNIDTWILWNLTERRVHATDHTNASRTMLFNIERMDWDDELLSLFDIPPSMLPKVHPSRYPFGIVDVCGHKIPINAIMGDQQSALFGQSCFSEGEMKITLGTGGFMLMNTGRTLKRSEHGLLTTVAWTVDDDTQYAIEGSFYAAGSIMEWLRDKFGMVIDVRDTEKIADSVDDTAGCYFVPAFSGLGAPYWEQSSRGMIVGLTLGVGKEHIIRATLESIAFQINDIIDAMVADTNVKPDMIRLDGGVSCNNFLCQFIADITNTKAICADCHEATALGVAHLSGKGTLWDTFTENDCGRTFTPAMSDEERKERISEWRRAIKTAIYWSKI